MVSGISITSLLANNKHLDTINVFYCDYKIGQKNKDRLQKVVNGYANAKLIFINAEKYHKIFIELGVRPWHGVYVTWLKMLVFGDLSLDTDRVLFINGHTIINGSLDELIDLNFDNNVMALGYDCLTNDHKSTIGLDRSDSYYNCGIMLINHKKWIDDGIAEIVKSHLQEKSDYVIADQDLCNVLFRGQIKALSSTYNYSSAYYAYNIKSLLKLNDLRPEYFYSYEELMENYYTPKIIHSLFGVTGKPWEQGNKHPQRFLWKKYIDMTPWRNVTKPVAKRTLTWRLYDILPKSIFMFLYMVAIRRKFGRQST